MTIDAGLWAVHCQGQVQPRRLRRHQHLRGGEHDAVDLLSRGRRPCPIVRGHGSGREVRGASLQRMLEDRLRGLSSSHSRQRPERFEDRVAISDPPRAPPRTSRGRANGRLGRTSGWTSVPRSRAKSYALFEAVDPDRHGAHRSSSTPSGVCRNRPVPRPGSPTRRFRDERFVGFLGLLRRHRAVEARALALADVTRA